MKKIVKLINNERNNKAMLSQKAQDKCDSTAHDYCPSIDYGICSLYATDVCSKRDYAGCAEGAQDKCSIDTYACIGSNTYDID